MDKHRRCLACGKLFTPNPCVPRQQYCSAVECQKTRRRLTQKLKMANDSAYRDNQRRAQKQWRDSNRSYWQRYRAEHPEYAQRNREQQRERNRRQRDQRRSAIAKMDELPRKKLLSSGRYRLIPLDCTGVAKMDEQIVEIFALKEGCG